MNKIEKASQSGHSTREGIIKAFLRGQAAVTCPLSMNRGHKSKGPNFIPCDWMFGIKVKIHGQ